MLNSTYDWNGVRPPYILATENDSLNAVCMLLGNQLTGQAQIFADVRTYWSPDSVERVTGFRPEQGFLHLINSGSAALDGTGQHKDANGNPTHQTGMGSHGRRRQTLFGAYPLVSCGTRILQRGRFIFSILNQRWHAVHHAPH